MRLQIRLVLGFFLTRAAGLQVGSHGCCEDKIAGAVDMDGATGRATGLEYASNDGLAITSGLEADVAEKEESMMTGALGV